MSNVASAIERQYPKPDIQLEKNNTQLMHYKDAEHSAEPSWNIAQFSSTPNQNIQHYLLPLHRDHRATMPISRST
jgi:hypothetical protein